MEPVPVPVSAYSDVVEQLPESAALSPIEAPAVRDAREVAHCARWPQSRDQSQGAYNRGIGRRKHREQRGPCRPLKAENVTSRS